MAWGACEARGSTAGTSYARQFAELGISAFLRLGDTPYVNQSVTAWGRTTSGVDVDTTVAEFKAIYEQSDVNPWVKQARAAVPVCLRMWDDHELGGNNWDHTYNSAEDSSPIGSSNDGAGQLERNEHFYRAAQAFWAYRLDNPPNADSGVAAQIPSGATMHSTSPSSANYWPKYYRIGFDLNGQVVSAAPLVELYVVDCITHRDPYRAADRSTLSIATEDATMLGSTQLAWLLARIAASEATFKVLASSKRFFTNSGGNNPDGWAQASGGDGYETERDAILDALAAVPGAIILSGDRHNLQATHRSIDDGDDHDALEVTAGRLGGDSAAGTQDAATRFFSLGPGFGVLEITAERCDASLRNAAGRVLWRGGVAAGSNALSYPDARVVVAAG